ncbi:MAG TPA: flagellar export chaperone FliS [Synergistaceae bacterium]|nr:flagellar export chaperone FliS [Synergistaceae bacterium]HPJ25457.1 flagellar export chaperone FliS [Synergistaceae bacterium]HPQ36720.1 flagellar export chaperone FliS [Synergistaceae bacterium]
MEHKKLQQHAQDTYRENQIRTASREQLLVITYDIGISACKIAEEAIERNDVETKNISLQRAQRVLRELMVSLNPERDEELAGNLTNLYEFLFYQLVQANVSNKVEPVQQVREMLMELRNTWVEAMEKLCAEEEDRAPRLGDEPMVEVAVGGTGYSPSSEKTSNAPSNKGGFTIAG